jgi:hypothetical protein
VIGLNPRRKQNYTPKMLNATSQLVSKIVHALKKLNAFPLWEFIAASRPHIRLGPGRLVIFPVLKRNAHAFPFSLKQASSIRRKKLEQYSNHFLQFYNAI